MPMSSGGHVESSSDCATRPKAREIGLTGYAVPTQPSLHIGRYVMATAEHREPCDSRGSCTVVCPVKAGMFSREQTCRGRSQSPVVWIAEEMETEPSKPIDKTSRGEVTSHRKSSEQPLQLVPERGCGRSYAVQQNHRRAAAGVEIGEGGVPGPHGPGVRIGTGHAA